MTIEQFNGVKNAESASSTDGLTYYSQTAEAPKSQSLEREPARTSLNDLIQNLTGKHRGFKAKFEGQLKNLAPLATFEDGGATLTSLRMAAGLTQAQLAQRVGQKQSNLSLIESGMRTNVERSTMRKLCGALNCDMNTLDIAIENSARMNGDYFDRQEVTRELIAENKAKKSA